MRAGARAESVESRGSTAWNDGLYPLDGAGVSDGGITTSQDSGTGTGRARGKGKDAVGKTSWFDPLDLSMECKDGVCPVPWATKEETPAAEVDLVNSPPHYIKDGGIECIEAIEAQLTTEEYQGYLRGNSVKYLWRWRHKGEVQDLKKAQWYLDRLIAFTEAQKG